MQQHTLRKIYAPIDESAPSREAIPAARTMARLSGASLHLVHAVDPNEPRAPKTPGELKEHLALERSEMEGAVLELVAGPPSQAIPTIASQGPLSAIVLPAHPSDQPRPPEGLSLFARQILENSICPVLLVPPDPKWENWRASRILLPQDSTAQTASAIGPAVTLAEHNQATLLVLHVPSYSTGAFSPENAALPFPRYMDQPQHEFPAWKQEFTERLRELAHIPESLEVQLVLALGEPADEILEWTRKLQADLIAIPWGGNFEKALIMRKVIESAECPILAIPIRPKPEEGR